MGYVTGTQAVARSPRRYSCTHAQVDGQGVGWWLGGGDNMTIWGNITFK